VQPPSVLLPPLREVASPNHSSRRGVTPWLIVVHRPAGSYASALRTLGDPRPDDPAAAVSAHILTDSSRQATQLVAWDRKAWTCQSFNSASYNIEADDNAWNGSDPGAFYTVARVVAFLAKRTGIPPRWTRDPLSTPGVVRHLDLGSAGGSHSDPTTDLDLWRRFVARVKAEHDHGGFKPTYGLGELHRIDT
jgi:N-acetyl-anhydromuramyl-L-alanine amidase AmpD